MMVSMRFASIQINKISNIWNNQFTMQTKRWFQTLVLIDSFKLLNFFSLTMKLRQHNFLKILLHVYSQYISFKKNNMLLMIETNFCSSGVFNLIEIIANFPKLKKKLVWNGPCIVYTNRDYNTCLLTFCRAIWSITVVSE